jgi:hypothetical protein
VVTVPSEVGAGPDVVPPLVSSDGEDVPLLVDGAVVVPGVTGVGVTGVVGVTGFGVTVVGVTVVGVTGVAGPVVVSDGDVVTTPDGPGVSLGLEQEEHKRATGMRARSATGEVREVVEPKRCFIGSLSRALERRTPS